MARSRPVHERRSMTSFVAGSLLVMLLTAALGACGTSGGSGGSAGGGGSATTSASLDGLTIERQAARAVTKTIGVDGGSMAIEAKDGTTFAFDVPAGALPSDTKITATPATLGGTDIPASVVMFEPTGLFFIEPATLEVVPAKDVPVGRQLMFNISDDASEIAAAPVDPKEKAAIMQVGHFSGWGLADVSDSQRAAMLERQASDAEARIQSHMAKVLGEERQRQLLGDESGSGELAGEFEKASKEYEEQVIRPRLEAAGSSCAATTRAVQTVLGYERQRQLLGMDEGGTSGFNGMEIVLGALKDGGPCEREAIADCKAKKDPSVYVRFLLGRERLRQLLGSEGSEGLGDIIDKAKRTCLPQRYTVSGGGNGLSVTGTIEDVSKPFKLNGTFPGGQAVFTYSPASDRGGSYKGALSGSGVTGSVAGTYSISGNDGEVLTLTGKEGGCVDQVAGSCRNNTQVLTLTPAD